MVEGRGNAFVMFLKEGRKGDCGNAKNSGKDSGTSEETIPEGQAGEEGADNFSMDSACESLWRKMIGKPYSGKPNVRFDEGKLEIEHGLASEALQDERGRNRYA